MLYFLLIQQCATFVVLHFVLCCAIVNSHLIPQNCSKLGRYKIMLKISRHDFIEQELRKRGSVLISDLCQQLDCSTETIRRDLKELEAAGKVQRIYGGAYLPEAYDKGVPIKLRETFFPQEKQYMADLAMKFIADGEVIMLDSSSTCLRLAQTLLDANRKVTIITNSLSICGIFDKYPIAANVFCLGGKLRSKTSSFVGYKTTELIKSFVVDKAFISCPSLDIHFGLTDNNLDDAMVRKTMLEHSRQHFLIADHTKFTSKSEVVIADLTQINTIITNREVSPEWKAKCDELHITLDYC